MYHYQCYGLTIASEVELASLLISKEIAADLQVFMRKAIAFEKEGAKYVNGFWINAKRQVFFEVDFGCMLISDGKKIEFSLNKEELLTEATQHVLGSGMGAILIQRGKLVLHASVVEKDKKATLFIGRSGAGKSSTAWTCIQNGYSLVSDDLAVIDLEGEIPYVHFGYPRSKVAQDVILEIEHEIDSKEKPFDEDRLKYYRYPQRFTESKVLLKYIFLLQQKEVDEPMLSQDANSGLLNFQQMYRNSFRFSLIQPLGFSKKHLQLCTSLFQKVTTKSIEMPRDKLSLNSTFELIETQMN